MSYTRTVAQMVDDVRRRGEFLAPRPVHADVVSYLNEAYAEFYDVLVAADKNRFGSTDAVSVVAGTSAYDLPADFLTALSLSVSDGSSASGRKAISFVEWQERDIYFDGEVSKDKRHVRWTIYAGQVHLFPTPDSSYTLYIQYAPVTADYATDGSDDAETYELVSGMGREYVTLGALIRCGEQEEQDTKQWEARLARLGQKIQTQLRVQRSEPRIVANVYGHDSLGRPFRRR